MGYESKIYIVQKTTSCVLENGQIYAQTLACFKLGKCRGFAERMRRNPPTNCYIFSDDGNTPLVEDHYGEPLTEATIDDVITIVEKCISESEYYEFLLLPLYAALKTYDMQKTSYGKLAVLHFGY